MFQVKILKSIIEQECIHFPFVNGEPATFHPIFVHEYDHILQIMGEHIRFVSRCEGVEQQGFSIGNNSGRFRIAQTPAAPTSLARHALVPPAENGHFAPPGLQSSGKLLHNRRFASTANGEIAYANHQTPQSPFAEDSFSIKIQPELYQPVVNERQREKQPTQQRSANSMTSFENHVDPEFFQLFKSTSHV